MGAVQKRTGEQMDGQSRETCCPCLSQRVDTFVPFRLVAYDVYLREGVHRTGLFEGNVNLEVKLQRRHSQR